MAISAILFDIGNVLVTFDHGRSAARLLPASKLNLEQIRSVILEHLVPMERGQIRSEEFVSRCVQITGYSGTHQEWAEAYCDIFELNRPMWEFVAQLPANVATCFFSNTSELHENFIFRRYPEFSGIPQGIFSWRVGSMKPDDGIYTAALDLLKRPPGEILHIDDAAANLETGQKFGIRTFCYDFRDHDAFLAAMRSLGL
jgi:putative hydrolase of the HAD superfamily